MCENLNECKICFSHIDQKIKLPCGHGICKSCLTKWSLISNNQDNNKDITCPFCRKVILTYSEINFERDNYRSILENITNSSTKKYMLHFDQESEYMENCILERSNK